MISCPHNNIKRTVREIKHSDDVTHVTIVWQDICRDCLENVGESYTHAYDKS